MKVKIETRGIPELQKKLKNLSKAGKKAFSEELLKGGHMVELSAKGKCPVLTGRLRSSITTEPKKWNEVHIGTNVEYGPHVENGTYRQRPQPFLRPALHENARKIRNMLVTRMKTLIT